MREVVVAAVALRGTVEAEEGAAEPRAATAAASIDRKMMDLVDSKPSHQDAHRAVTGAYRALVGCESAASCTKG